MDKAKKIKDANEVIINGIRCTVLGVVEKLRRVVSKPFLVKDIYERWTDGTMAPDEFLQRMEGQWAKKQNSRLISAMLNNRPIGTIIIATGRTYSNKNVFYSVLDGLQRIHAIVSFINNGFRLDKNEKPIECDVKYDDGSTGKISFDIAGKNFKSLPKAMQNFFLDYVVRVDSYECFTDEELDDIMFCVNNGKSPTSYQKMRFSLGTENMRLIQPIVESIAWEEVAKCNDKNDSKLCSVLRGLMVFSNCVDNGLSSNSINKFIDDFEDNISSGTLTKFANVVESFGEVKMKMTEEERKLLDGCNLPHFITNFDVFNSLENKNGKTYLDFFREFTKSEDWLKFTSYKAKKTSSNTDETGVVEKGEKSGSGGTQYSEDSVNERQYIIDNFLYDFLDCSIPYNGAVISNKNTRDEINEEVRSNAEAQSETNRTGSIDGADRDIKKDDFGESNVYNSNMQDDFESGRQTIRIEQNQLQGSNDEETTETDEQCDRADGVCNSGYNDIYERVQAG